MSQKTRQSQLFTVLAGRARRLGLVLALMIVLPMGTAPVLDMEGPKTPIIILLKERPTREHVQAVVEVGATIKYRYGIINGIAASIPEVARNQIARLPFVEQIEPDVKLHALEQTLPWGVNRIDAELVYPLNKGTGVKIAIIDSGIDYTHPDLDANYQGGYDFVGSDADPMDDNGHGTWAAGIAAAEDNTEGVVGVAPEAWLYSLKVLDAGGSGYISDIVAAIEWAARGPDGIAGNEDDADIISMSLGYDGPQFLTSLSDACSSAYGAGLLLVAAAGNHPPGPEDVEQPAEYDSVIAVAATNPDDSVGSYSDYGPEVELAAPGTDILSTGWPLHEYHTGSGTSGSAPHVSGVAALIWAAEPSLSNDAVRARLQGTAEDLGDPGKDYYFGYGLVDASQAVATPGLDADKVDGHDAVYSGATAAQRANKLVWTQSNGLLHVNSLPLNALNQAYVNDDRQDTIQASVDYSVGHGAVLKVNNTDVSNGGYAIVGTNASNYVWRPAIYGYNSGNSAGVYGSSKNWHATVGWYTGTSSNYAGVYGHHPGGGYGVWGYSYSGTGVYGNTSSGYGVRGYHAASSGTGFGVYGSSASTSGYGGYFYSKGYGVVGYSASTSKYGGYFSGSGSGVYGYGANYYGGYFWGKSYGLVAQSSTGYGAYISSGGSYAAYIQGSNHGLQARTNNASKWAGVFYSSGGGVYISVPSGKWGLYVAGGSKSAAVPTDDGTRLLYSEESTEVWFTDYGFGKLQDGVATIAIDPIFAQTVNLQEPYHVFVQVYDDAQVYVTNRTPTQFEVHLSGGKGKDAEFSYRIVAKRLGFEEKRLEQVDEAEMAQMAEVAEPPQPPDDAQVLQEPPPASEEVQGPPDTPME